MPIYQPANETLEEPRLILRFPAGLNQNQTPDIGEASDGYNFELGARQSILTPRLPFDLKGTAPNNSAITGISQLIKHSGTQTTLVFAGTNVYQWDGTSTWTLKGSVTVNSKMRDTYWSLGDYLIFSDVGGSNVVSMWDGTTYQAMPTGLAGTFSAKYSLVFNNRVWFFNITSAGVNYPHMIVVSAFENPQSLNIAARGGPTNLGGTTFATGLEAFYLFVPDLKAINGATVFQNVLIISTSDGQLFKLTGTSAADYQFTNFYLGSSAVGTETMANIGNDVMYIRKGGNINLMRSVLAFGDVRSNDVGRWIPNTVKNVRDCITVYDQTAQKIYFFITGMVLVLFKDILYGAETDTAINQGLSPWSIYKTNHPNSFNTSAAKYLQIPGTTNYSVYWGDSSGNVYDMNGTGLSDAGIYPVQVSRTSKAIDEEVMMPFPWNEEILLGRVQYRRISAPSSLDISFQWMDEYNTSICSIPLKGPPVGNSGPVYNGAAYYNATSYYSQGFQFANVLSHQNFSPTGKGTGFYITLGNQGGANWQVDHLELM